MKTIEYKEVRVVTTELLAHELGATPKMLSNNYLANKDKYREGEHYFLLKGDELKEFKNRPENSGSVRGRANAVTLWTEKGCFNHVKSLGTDEAWEAFQTLVDKYFRQREALRAIKDDVASEENSLLMEFTKRPKQIQNSKDVNAYHFQHGGKEDAIDYNRKNCYYHTGMLPNEVIGWAKQKGLPAKDRTSSKAVFRAVKPEISGSMAAADEMCKTGKISIEDAAQFCKQHILPAMVKFKELGILPTPKRIGG